MWNILEGTKPFQIISGSLYINFDENHTTTTNIEFPNDLDKKSRDDICIFLVELFKISRIEQRIAEPVLLKYTYNSDIDLFYEYTRKKELHIQWIQKRKTFKIMMNDDRSIILAPLE